MNKKAAGYKLNILQFSMSQCSSVLAAELERSWNAWPNVRVRAEIGSHMMKSWKISFMPPLSTFPSFFPGVNMPRGTFLILCHLFFIIHQCFFPPSRPHYFSPYSPSLGGNKHNLCRSVVLLVLLSLILIKTYPSVPADDQYWVFREADVLPGYPQPLREYGQGVPAHKIDTAIWWEPNGYTYFFSGDRCTCQTYNQI